MKNNILEEISLITICVLATAIGPVILINAEFSFDFIISGLYYSLICLIFANIIGLGEIQFLKQINKKTKYIIGYIVGYIPFLIIISYYIISYYSWGNFEVLFKISKSSALFNVPVIIGVNLLVFAYLMWWGRDIKTAIYKSGLYFTLPLFFVFLMIPSIPNSEGKVILGNVAIIYFSLKIINKNKDSLLS